MTNLKHSKESKTTTELSAQNMCVWTITLERNGLRLRYLAQWLTLALSGSSLIAKVIGQS